MKTAWIPILKYLSLLVLAVFIFFVLYDCLSKGMKLKDSLKERLLFLLFRDGLGWIIYIIGAVVIFFLVYSIFFE